MVAPMLLVALAQINLPANAGMHWHTDYAAAMKAAQTARKPLAVFIAKGKSGWDSMAVDGHLNGKAFQTLKDSYVCLYLDTTKAKGKETAELFGNTEKPTLIVSDRTLEYQAYRASGSQSNDQMAQVLKRFATHEGPAPSEPEVRRSNYQPASPSPSTTVVPCRG